VYIYRQTPYSTKIVTTSLKTDILISTNIFPIQSFPFILRVQLGRVMLATRYKNKTKIFVFKLAVCKKGKERLQNSHPEGILLVRSYYNRHLIQSWPQLKREVRVSQIRHGLPSCAWHFGYLLIIVGIVCFGWHDMESVIQNVLQASLMTHEKLWSILIPYIQWPMHLC